LWSSADGVGIFFKTHDVEIIRRRDVIPGRLLMVDCFYKGDKYRVVNVYTSPTRTQKMQLFKRMKELLFVGYNLILCGDFNTVTEENDRCSSVSFKLSREAQLNILVKSDIKIWEILRHRMRDFFKFKSKELNLKMLITIN
uniref:Endonuclease/exonuclease/phosphatase domain-containing protein n=1 Tax=Anabas testudineus TaxID=64144 RepID=A0A7N6BPG2_ANATE